MGNDDPIRQSVEKLRASLIAYVPLKGIPDALAPGSIPFEVDGQLSFAPGRAGLAANFAADSAAGVVAGEPGFFARMADFSVSAWILPDLDPAVPDRLEHLAGGVVVNARTGELGYLQASDLGRIIAHELGHWLGLTHASSRESPGNLMRSDPRDYGEALSEEQRFILRAHPQVVRTA